MNACDTIEAHAYTHTSYCKELIKIFKEHTYLSYHALLFLLSLQCLVLLLVKHSLSSVYIEHILFIDIETVPIHYQYQQLSSSEKELWDKKMFYVRESTPELQYAKAGVYAEFAKVVCIGLGFIADGKFRTKAIAGENETELLLEFTALLSQHFNTSNHFLCAHNGKEFDFPFLCRRLLVNKIPLPKLLQIQGFKPWEVKHLDTMEMWRFGDIKNFTSLNYKVALF